MTTIDGINNGRSWCLHARRPNVDMWRALWHALEDQGGLSDLLAIEHVKGHRTQKGALTTSDQEEKKGNDYADLAAKRGLDKHDVPTHA
eukprot:3679897-Pyramimonas_sp.AAC.1